MKGNLGVSFRSIDEDLKAASISNGLRTTFRSLVPYMIRRTGSERTELG